MTPRYSSDDRTYRIVRFFQDPEIENTVVRVNMTIEQAKAWCNNPETSSVTCTTSFGRRRTEMYGPWFDRWQVEE